MNKYVFALWHLMSSCNVNVYRESVMRMCHTKLFNCHKVQIVIRRSLSDTSSFVDTDIFHACMHACVNRMEIKLSFKLI